MPSSARFIAVTPDGGQALSGSVQVFTATVTDANGRPVQGVTVDFTETGAGFIRNNTSATTDAAEIATTSKRAGQRRNCGCASNRYSAAFASRRCLRQVTDAAAPPNYSLER